MLSYLYSHGNHTVELPISDHSNCQDLRGRLQEVVAYEKSPLRSCPDTSTFRKIILLRVIAKLRYVQFHAVIKSSSYILSSIVHATNIEIRQCVMWSLTRSSKQWKIINHQPPKMVAIAYRNWSFTRGSNCKVLNGKNWGVLDRWSHMEDGLYYSDK